MKKAIFYKFNNKTNESEVIKCNLKKAYELYGKEELKQVKSISDWTYFDITISGKLLRKFRA